MVFPVVMYGCESWTIKKAECRRIDAFELWCWRRLLRVPWTARRSNQSILKEITPEYSLERVGHDWATELNWLIGRTDAEALILWPPDMKNWFIGKDLDVGKDSRQEKGTTEDKMTGWHHQLNGHEFEQDPGDGGQKPGVLQSMGLQRVGHDWATEGQQEKCSKYSSICTLLRVYPLSDSYCLQVSLYLIKYLWAD